MEAPHIHCNGTNYGKNDSDSGRNTCYTRASPRESAPLILAIVRNSNDRILKVVVVIIVFIVIVEINIKTVKIVTVTNHSHSSRSHYSTHHTSKKRNNKKI